MIYNIKPKRKSDVELNFVHIYYLSNFHFPKRIQQKSLSQLSNNKYERLINSNSRSIAFNLLK